MSGGGIVAIAVVTAALLATDGDTSVSDAVDTGAGDATMVTELDLDGIPTTWSGRPAAHPRPRATPTDLHGIPTTWSGRPTAP